MLFLLTISSLLPFTLANPLHAIAKRQAQGQTYKASFTWNPSCPSSVSCGWAGQAGLGAAAINTAQFYLSTGGEHANNGIGSACGECWHIQPETDCYPSNGLQVGKPAVVKINDECPDAGVCDFNTTRNSKPTGEYDDAEVHLDLCGDTKVTEWFYGQIGSGVIMGKAQKIDCEPYWDDGQFGSSAGSIQGGPEIPSSYTPDCKDSDRPQNSGSSSQE